MRIDERSAGFLAVGLARSSGIAAVITTSGTAVANLHPAVLEAHHAGVPLVVISADRPGDLRGVGANQTIEQSRIFGASVRYDHEIGAPDSRTGQVAYWRSTVSRAVLAARGLPSGDPGPVHLNLPFREPLVGTPGPLPPARDGAWTRQVAGAPTASAELTALARPLAGRRGIAVAGASPGDDGALVHATAAALGWPVVADPRSPAWRPEPTLVNFRYDPALPDREHDELLAAARAEWVDEDGFCSRCLDLYPGKRFPRAPALLATTPEALRKAGMSAGKAASLLDLAAHVHDGRLRPGRLWDQSDEAVAAALLYVNRRKEKKNEPKQPGPIPSGEPPETD